MRQMSVARSQNKGRLIYHGEPKPGTALRKVWDLFQASRGRVIIHVFSKHQSVQVSYLRDVYGLDLRSFGDHRWCLVGEWLEDGTYVDYLTT